MQTPDTPITVGTLVSAPLTPPRTYRRQPVRVSGIARTIDGDALTIRTPGGDYTVPYATAQVQR